jgi:uncharacterized repeat protein (TIGR03803 family)
MTKRTIARSISFLCGIVALVCSSGVKANSNLVVLRQLTVADGQVASPLVEGPDGWFYGLGEPVTDFGRIFRMSPTPAPGSTEHSFETVLKFDGQLVGLGGTNLLFRRSGRLVATAQHGDDTVVLESITLAPFTYRILHTFSKNDFNQYADGQRPIGRMAELADGSLIGVTYRGGKYGAGQGLFGGGTLYRIGADGWFSVLHEFEGSAKSPLGLVVAADETIYGTSSANDGFHGGSGTGAIWRFRVESGFEVLHSLAAFDGATQRYPEGVLVWDSLTVGSDGFLYGTTTSGGTIPGVSNGAIFRFDPGARVFDVLYSFPAGAAGQPTAELVEGPDRNFYGVNNGGPYWSTQLGAGTVFRFDAGARVLTLLHEFKGPDGGGPYRALLVGADKRLYGSTQTNGAFGRGTIFALESPFLDVPLPPQCQAPGVPSVTVPQVVEFGATVSASGVASGTAPLHFTWLKGEDRASATPVYGTTATSIDIGPITRSVTLWLQVSNACGMQESPGTRVVVSPATPVLLVHGWNGDPSSFGQMEAFLENDGWQERVFAFDYSTENNLTIEELAAQLAARVEEIRGVTQSDKIDIVAHSMGGLITRAWVAGLATPPHGSGLVLTPYTGQVRRLVTIATPHYGAAGASWEVLCRLEKCRRTQMGQLEFGSTFIWKLHDAWAELTTEKPAMFFIAGTQGDGDKECNGEGCNDGIVEISSAVLEYTDPSAVRYVPYPHASMLGVALFRGIADIHEKAHPTYRIVHSYLMTGAAVDQSALGYIPPHQRGEPAESEGLLMIRYLSADKKVLRGPAQTTFSLDPKTFFHYLLSDQTSTVTAWGVEAGRYNATLANRLGSRTDRTGLVLIARPTIQTITVTPQGAR